METASDPILGEWLSKLWYIHSEWYVVSQRTIRKTGNILILQDKSGYKICK